MALLCHPLLLTAAGASGPRPPPSTQGLGLGSWLAGVISVHMLLKSQGACSSDPTDQDTGLAAPPTPALYPVPWEAWREGEAWSKGL